MKLSKQDTIQIALVIILALFGLSMVYWVNTHLGYNPSIFKGLRNAIIILLLVPFCFLMRLVGYKGSFRLLIIAAALTAIGLTLRYDFEIKHYFNHPLPKADIVNSKQLAVSLKAGETPLTKYILDRFKPLHKSLLETYAGEEMTGETALTIKAEKDELSWFVKKNLSRNMRRKVNDYEAGEPVPANLGGAISSLIKQVLYLELNEIIKGENIYEEARFKGITIDADIKRMIERNPQLNDELIRLNKALLNDAFPEEIQSRQLKLSVGAVSKFIQGYLFCLVIFLSFRKEPEILLRNWPLLLVISVLVLIGYKIGEWLTGRHFLFGGTPWDFAIPMLVLVFAGYITEYGDGMADLKKRLFPPSVYWAPLVIICIIPAFMFILINEFGVFMIMGLFLVLMLFLSTERAGYLLLSLGLILFFGGLLIFMENKLPIDLGHVGNRISIFSNFWKGFPADFPVSQPIGDSFELQGWLGDPMMRGQHLRGYLAIWHGGLFGVGLGLGYPNIIPVAYSDFMTASIVENLGVIGLLLVTALVLAYSLHCFKVARISGARFLTLALQGFGLLFIVQFFVSVAGVLSLLPMTGVPIPFVSRANVLMIVTYGVIGYIMTVENKVASRMI